MKEKGDYLNKNKHRACTAICWQVGTHHCTAITDILNDFQRDKKEYMCNKLQQSVIQNMFKNKTDLLTQSNRLPNREHVYVLACMQHMQIEN